MATDAEKVYIQNKTAQLMALVFVVDYPDRWPSFIADVLSTLHTGANAVDLYLRLLLAIDTEVVDREIIHTQAESERNNRIKDTMREHCVVDLTNSWYDILVKYEKSHPSLVCQCHDVIGAYICWIDITLIANDRLDKKEVEKKIMIRQAVESKVTLLLVFMASDYDDISAAVFDFARDYIQMIKQNGGLSEVERGLLENMLYVVITKTKYDESYNFDQAGEEEAMFDDYRKRLKVVFDNLAALIPEVVLKVTKEYVVTTLNRWQASSYEDVEAAVSLLYNLGEALPASHGNHFSGPTQGGDPASLQVSQVKTSTMQEMMRLLVSSGVSAHSHPAVSLQFFECVARYEKFFACEVQFIPGILTAFLDVRGMRNANPRVGLEREVVGSGVRQLMHRLVVCLDGNSLLPLLPTASQALLHTPSTNALTEYLPLINQSITKFQKDIGPFLQNIFVPLVSAIFTALSEPLEENEEEEKRTRRLLQRGYYLFLTTIVSNNLLDTLAALDATTLHQVLMSVVQGAVEFPDPVAQKNCFVILRRLTEAWGEKDVGPPGFVEFLYTQTTFDLNDAQTILALHESVTCLQSVYKRRGEELVSYLRSEYLPKMEVSPELIAEYCQALTSDAKFFRNYSKIFFQRAKS
ncbi:Exportin-T [Portunus trituberculatus]|uniref:Exportin-T n=1 Tax=Portunus trituberculatus TaxID=210409 RepID=A0A5B7CSC4_PORTR|nr:Exportin-T [Portunus trituberculatus]